MQEGRLRVAGEDKPVSVGSAGGIGDVKCSTAWHCRSKVLELPEDSWRRIATSQTAARGGRTGAGRELGGLMRCNVDKQLQSSMQAIVGVGERRRAIAAACQRRLRQKRSGSR